MLAVSVYVYHKGIAMRQVFNFRVASCRAAVMAATLGLLATAGLQLPSVADDKKPAKVDTTSALDQSMKTLSGEKVDLSKYKGKVVLIVNTASECGLTPQYAGLQELYEKHREQGLVVLGFPCNQFGKQEPGSAKEISEFCTTNYGVTFDMFDKVEVNGDGACELYKQLTKLDLKPAGDGKITWNFEKFLLNRDGQPVARFAPKTAPDDAEFVTAVEALLADK